MPNLTKFRAACVQMRSGIDRAQNTKEALSLIAEAAKDGAKFVATPEMTNVVDRNPRRMFENIAAENDMPEIAAFSAAAEANKIWLLAGSFAVKVADTRAANRAFLFGPDGRVVAKYDKLHMFDVDLPNGESWKESAVYQPGPHPVLVDADEAKIGLSICYDVRFPRLYRTLAQSGATILCVPAAFTKQTGEAHWKTLLTARAIENGAFVIAPAQGGKHEDGRETYGHSLIIDPWGKVLAEAPGDEPCVISADIDLDRAFEARQRIPNLSLEQTFDVNIVKP